MLKDNKLFYPLAIFIIWLITYILCQVFLQQKLGWDEVSYLSQARGIVSDFDFSSRSYTIMGLLKHGYPTNLINFPVFSVFLSIFFKLFGVSLKISYFSSWLCALGVSLFIYYIFLLIQENENKSAFFLAMSYLFVPGILKTCDSAMMEQMGCLLLCISVYLLLSDYKKGKLTYLTAVKLALSFLVLWLYKSLFIGFFFGAFVFILVTYNKKIAGKDIQTQIPLPLFLGLSYGMFAVLFYLVKEFVFLPVAPMMNFTPDLEQKQLYADFLAGFFNDLPNNLFVNIKSFFRYVIVPFFIYPNAYTTPRSQFFVFVPHVIFNAICFFIFFISFVLTFAYWEKLKSIEKAFCGLTLGTIISFNLIFNFLFSTTYENMWRYNVYSLPLFLCYSAIILKIHFSTYIKQFFVDHPLASKAVVPFQITFIWVPLFLSMLNAQLVLWDGYHDIAHKNAQLVRFFLKEDRPKFIYLNDGSHTVFEDYPVRQVFKDATNEQLLQVNKVLPEPVKYLFLKPSDWLFQNNKDFIVKGLPIIDNQYEFFGFNNEAQLVVYKLKSL